VTIARQAGRQRGVMGPPLLRKDECIGQGLSAGRWQVVQKIGDGGFAEVYEVLDLHNSRARVRSPAPAGSRSVGSSHGLLPA